MKKKLMVYILTTLILSITIITGLFIYIANFQYRESIKKELLMNNNIYINVIDSGNAKNIDKLFDETAKDSSIRLTYISNDGTVLKDSYADSATMENHNDRNEVIDARIFGVGTAIRFSETYNKSMIYVASEFNNGQIMRSAITLDFVNLFTGRYIWYYLIITFSVIVLVIIITVRLGNIFIKPIKQLEITTAKFAKGEFNRRYIVKTTDEIGNLGKAFNNMASRLQETLKDSLEKQNRLEAILKSMDSGVIAVDKNNKILMINPYAKQIFGIEIDIIGKDLMHYIRDFEFENVFKNSGENYKEIRIIWPSERILRIKTADIINEGDHIGTVAVVQDITEIKRLENMRSEFVANVSHELKTPLTSIKGFAETLKYVKDEEKKEKFLDIINDETERLTRLINDILILSDIEIYREAKHEIIDMNDQMEDVYYLMKHIADSRNIEISIEGDKVENIIGDGDRFKQMLINLVDNAIKYSEAGDKVIIRTYMSGDKCILSVEDTGVGIPKEHIPRLFERFYRVDKARSRARGGTGLGLAIVKHIVLGFNGTIEVKSQIEAGSKFIVSIPMYKGN